MSTVFQASVLCQALSGTIWEGGWGGTERMSCGLSSEGGCGETDT